MNRRENTSHFTFFSGRVCSPQNFFSERFSELLQQTLREQRQGFHPEYSTLLQAGSALSLARTQSSFVVLENHPQYL